MDSHGHQHDAALALDRRLWLSAGLNIGITVVEFVGGFLAGSVSLLADATHNLSDVFALVMAALARRLGRREPTLNHSYGLKRLEVIAALLNTLILLVITAFIIRAAILRLLHPVPVERGIMLVAASLALAVNLGSVFLLRSHDHEDLNVRSAMLHLLQDALGAVAVLLAALFANSPAGPYLDPIAALAVSFAVLQAALTIVFRSLHILAEGTPKDLDLEDLAQQVGRRFPLVALHHVHVWELGPGRRVMTAHLTVEDMPVSECELLLDEVRAFLDEHWSIRHVTLEPEVAGCGRAEILGSWTTVGRQPIT